MRIETFIGLRFLRSKRQSRAISIITWISTGGVMLGVTALIVTISVMNGFRENLFIAVSGTTPHLRIQAPKGVLVPSAREALEKELEANPAVTLFAPYVSRQAFLAVGEEYRAVILRGIDPGREAGLTEVGRFLRPGNSITFRLGGGSALPAAGGGDAAGRGTGDSRVESLLGQLAYPPPPGQRAGIILGAPLARALGLLDGDEVRVISPVQRVTPIGPVPLMKNFRLVGTFDTGLGGTDEVLAYVDYRVAQRLFRMGAAVDGLAARLKDPHATDLSALRNALPEARLIHWSEENKNVFQVMRLEKLGLFLILSLIIVVSFFNIISSLIMLVLEKRKAIAILKTMGATDRLVRRTFFMQGIWIGTLGTLGGVALGLATCWVLATFDLIRFPEGVFPLSSRLPIRVDWLDLLIIVAASFAICMLVTLYPATRAARVQPVDNLRFE